MTQSELESAVREAKAELAAAERELQEFIEAPENNVYSSIEDAEELEDVLQDRADADCEGSYCCGDEFYRQEFIVDGEHYNAILRVEYNRHDKTYYYVDGTEFEIVKL